MVHSASQNTHREAEGPVGGDGWVEWSGGENPVPGRLVSVVRRWRAAMPRSKATYRSESFHWHHRPMGHGGGDDIVAYRVASDAVSPASQPGMEARDSGPE